jgi:galactokinase/mevalonate kinase-like predicted kinase
MNIETKNNATILQTPLSNLDNYLAYFSIYLYAIANDKYQNGSVLSTFLQQGEFRTKAIKEIENIILTFGNDKQSAINLVRQKCNKIFQDFENIEKTNSVIKSTLLLNDKLFETHYKKLSEIEKCLYEDYTVMTIEYNDFFVDVKTIFNAKS